VRPPITLTTADKSGKTRPDGKWYVRVGKYSQVFGEDDVKAGRHTVWIDDQLKGVL
jgi:hypothetical protein